MKDLNTLKDIEDLQQCELENVDSLDSKYKLLKQDFV